MRFVCCWILKMSVGDMWALKCAVVPESKEKRGKTNEKKNSKKMKEMKMKSVHIKIMLR